MKLKNEALQELYETIVNGTFTFSPYAECPMDKAFRKCDDCIGNLQNSNDILEKSNGTLLGANLDLCSKNHDLKNRIKQLENDHESDVKVIGKLHSQMVNLEDEKTEQEKRADILKSQRDMLKKELDEAKKQLNYFTKSRDDWRSRAKHEEEQKLEQVKRADSLADQVEQLKKEVGNLQSRAHCAEDEVEQLKKDRDIWIRNNCERQVRISELLKKLEAREEELDSWTKKHLEATTQIDELKKQLDELTSQYQKLTIENKRLYEQGQTDLWDMLQNVNDSQPNEFDVECEGMDLEDFLDAYKKWQEQKETDRMRDWLADFCYGRVCEGCPLESNKYKCGCGLSFKRANPLDTKIIPDKDIKRCYEKALSSVRCTSKNVFDSTTMEGVNKAISKACENFCKAVRDADIKIKENIPRNAWECTLEANVEVNRDLVEKAFGIKLEEEHKLEYGDAVRVPWRNHDYMYIGPEGKHIRLFDPKTHDVVLVSVTENLTYQGCKIVLCDEEDLRKIWKDKK